MKKTLFCLAMLMSGSLLASTDHYILRDGNHVHHLKVKKLNEEYTVEMDIDFEPNAEEKNSKPCDAEVSGEAKVIGENKIQLKKHSEGEANYCTLDITLSPTGAKVDQSKDCDNFVTGICHFTSEGKEIPKIK
ncbi:MAG: hypothetical protein FJ190_10400 [Gammaproteobacteria bacterium]|nr:hypothetical protein [Gammaproteobacteria bacterium]